MSDRPEEKIYDTLCRLIAAWVHDTPLGLAETPDYEALFTAADRHALTAAVCAAMESTGLMARCPANIAKRFRQAQAQALRRTLLMDTEREAILAALEERGVWYMPMKGAILNRLYPQYGTRQFADCDILLDPAMDKVVRGCMKGLGYKIKSAGRGAHDAYHKPPIYNVEMHRTLFSGGKAEPCVAYYRDVERRLVKDGGNGFGCHFTDEDFYVYFLAHSCKHWDGGGAGLRTLLDIYLYRRARPGMDEAYIAGELEKLGLTAFEELLRSLAEKLFGPAPAPALTGEERQALAWLESSGVYGTLAHDVQSDLRRLQGGVDPIGIRARIKYLLRRVFPDREWYRVNAPFVYRRRWALPFYWVWRLGRGVFVNGKRNLRALREVCVPREGESIFRLGAERVKGFVSRPFQTPASRWPPEKCAAAAMQTYEGFEGHSFDLAHPVLFTEKIVWYKLFYQHPDLVRIHDKYLFKGYIEEKLGPGYTAPLYGMWTSVRDLKRDWDSLPDSFCLKSNCSFAGRNLLLIFDRKSEDKKALFRQVRRWLDPMNTAINRSVPVYRDVTPRIMAEKLLPGEDGELKDYKVYCFDGQPYMIGAVADRFSNGEGGAFSYYDLTWARLPVTKKYHPSADVPRPRHLDEMLRLAVRLAEGFPFMRVDLYESEGKVLVGELTPFSGNHFDQRGFDLELGKRFVLPDRDV